MAPDGDEKKAIVIVRDQIPDLLDDEYFVSVFTAWHRHKLFGLPYEGGYMDQPCQWSDAVLLCEGMYNEHLERERK